MSSNVIQKIFRDHGTRYIESCGGSVQPEHYKVIKAICECRTGLRGKHLFECPECEYKELVNSSCGNRHCPVCQHKKAIQWVYEREIRTLPCNYFLATFTIPKDLRDIAYANQKIIYSALFKCAAESPELKGVASKAISLWTIVFNYSKGNTLIYKFSHFEMNYKNKFY